MANGTDEILTDPIQIPPTHYATVGARHPRCLDTASSLATPLSTLAMPLPGTSTDCQNDILSGLAWRVASEECQWHHSTNGSDSSCSTVAYVVVVLAEERSWLWNTQLHSCRVRRLAAWRTILHGCKVTGLPTLSKRMVSWYPATVSLLVMSLAFGQAVLVRNNTLTTMPSGTLMLLVSLLSAVLLARFTCLPWVSRLASRIAWDACYRPTTTMVRSTPSVPGHGREAGMSGLGYLSMPPEQPKPPEREQP